MYRSSFNRSLLAVAVFAGLSSWDVSAQPQTVSGPVAQHAEAVPAVRDWSNRSVIHRRVMTPEQFEAAGRGEEIWSYYRDPRYVAEVLRKLEAGQLGQPVGAQPAAMMQPGKASLSHRRPRPVPKTESPTDEAVRDWSVTLGSQSRGVQGMFPAKFNFDIFAEPNCTTDFVTYPTGAAGSSGGQATIMGYNQIYQGMCNGPWNNNGMIKAPRVSWAYSTGNGFHVETSPVLSYLDDAKQVAYVQRNGNVLQLVLLKWRDGTGTSANAAATPVLSASAADYRSCVSNCYYVIPFSGTSNVGSQATFSSPYVDYGSDVLWAGDGNGRLHKFTGVFQGLPQEVTTAGFPVTVAGSGMRLSPPVAFQGKVFVGTESGLGAGNGGRVVRVDAASGAVEASSAELAVPSKAGEVSVGVREAIILDGALGVLYAFVFNDADASYRDSTVCNAFQGEQDGCRAIVQLPVNFTEGSGGAQRQVGRGNTDSERVQYAGAFDDAYYNSADGTGAMYILGGRHDNTYFSTLWKVPIKAGVLQQPVVGPAISGWDWPVNSGADAQKVSPVTLIKNDSPNNAGEYLYVSVAAYALGSGCKSGGANGNVKTDGCLFMFNLDNLQNGPYAQEKFYITIPNISTGQLKLEDVTITAGVDFVATGSVDTDASNLATAIGAKSGGRFTGGSINCYGSGASRNCNVLITQVAVGNMDDNARSTTFAGAYFTPIAQGKGPKDWSANAVPRAMLQATGGTSGIVVDNVRNETGSSQVYYIQNVSGGAANAVQASQKSLN